MLSDSAPEPKRSSQDYLLFASPALFPPSTTLLVLHPHPLCRSIPIPSSVQAYRSSMTPPPDMIRITTLCLSRLCIGWRSLDTGPPITRNIPDVISASIILSIAFIFVCILVIIVLLFLETIRAVISNTAPCNHDPTPVLSMHSKLADIAPLCSTSSNTDPCSICLETIESRSVVRILPCSHSFHATCIDAWLLQEASRSKCISRVSCPLCKSSVLSYRPSTHRKALLTSPSSPHAYHQSLDHIALACDVPTHFV